MIGLYPVPNFPKRKEHADVIATCHRQLQEALAEYPADAVIAYSEQLLAYIDDLRVEVTNVTARKKESK